MQVRRHSSRGGLAGNHGVGAATEIPAPTLPMATCVSCNPRKRWHKNSPPSRKMLPVEMSGTCDGSFRWCANFGATVPEDCHPAARCGDCLAGPAARGQAVSSLAADGPVEAVSRPLWNWKVGDPAISDHGELTMIERPQTKGPWPVLVRIDDLPVQHPTIKKSQRNICRDTT